MSDQPTLTHAIIILAELITIVTLTWLARKRNETLAELKENLKRDIEREGRRTRGEPDPDDYPTPPPFA